MTRIPDSLRQQVINHAGSCCEYCLISQKDCLVAHEVDHIISEKYHGETSFGNLCLSCLHCNRHKGSDIASTDVETGQLVYLFHPRRDIWSDHFTLDGAYIRPLTPRGRVTASILQLNSPYQLSRREGLITVQSYPCTRT
jgi:5-methylcytosine-specific restriction endonuclease McrA